MQEAIVANDTIEIVTNSGHNHGFPGPPGRRTAPSETSTGPPPTQHGALLFQEIDQHEIAQRVR
jgi:hypothetical protein